MHTGGINRLLPFISTKGKFVSKTKYLRSQKLSECAKDGLKPQPSTWTTSNTRWRQHWWPVQWWMQGGAEGEMAQPLDILLKILFQVVATVWNIVLLWTKKRNNYKGVFCPRKTKKFTSNEAGLGNSRFRPFYHSCEIIMEMNPWTPSNIVSFWESIICCTHWPSFREMTLQEICFITK